MSENTSPAISVENAVPNDQQEPGQVEVEKKSETTAPSASEEKSVESPVDAANLDEVGELGETSDNKWIGRRLERAKAKERQAAQAEIEYWKNAALGKNTAVENVAQTEPQAVFTDKPKFSDFNDIDAFTDAVTEWKLEQKLAQVSQQTQLQQVQKTYAERAAEFAKKAPDFPQVVHEFIKDYEGVNVPELMTVAMESTVGPDLVHYLAKNSHEMERILELPSHRRLIEFGLLENKIKAPAVVKPTKLTQAPQPVTPVSGSAPSNKTLEDLAKDSSTDNSAWREMRMKQRAGRY